MFSGGSSKLPAVFGLLQIHQISVGVDADKLLWLHQVG